VNLQACIEQAAQIITIIFAKIEGKVALGGACHGSLHKSEQSNEACHYLVCAKILKAQYV